MATTIYALARWARALTLDQLPPAVVERARYAHLSQAGAVRALADRPLARALRKTGGSRGAAALAGGGTSPRRDAVRLHSALASWISFDDPVFFSNPGPAGLSTVWAWARGRSVGDLLVASVAAQEIAARVGASLLLGPTLGAAVAPVHAAATAIAAGLLSGLDEEELAHALALSLAMPHRPPPLVSQAGGASRSLLAMAPALQALECVELAQAGVKGPTDLLDRADGLLGSLCWVPLRTAFTGLGRAWLTLTTSFSFLPAHPFAAVPVEAVAEILGRHTKAADKRLRADQLDRIEITMGAPGFALDRMMAGEGRPDPVAVSHSARRLIGALITAHELGPAQLDEAWLSANSEKVAEVSAKVSVRHDLGRTMAGIEHLIDVAAPLLAGVTLRELQTAGLRAQGVYGGPLPTPGSSELLALVKARPDRLMEAIRRAEPDLGAARLDEWQHRQEVEVKLFTSRGGTWPERRALAEGSPGWPWDDTRRRVLAKFAGEDAARAAAAPGLAAVELGASGEDWVAALLA